MEKILNIGIFIPFGMPIMMMNLFADIMYFWKNNFRTDLQQIIILREKSTVSHKSIRELLNNCDKFGKNKIKSAYSATFVKMFRRRF